MNKVSHVTRQKAPNGVLSGQKHKIPLDKVFIFV